MSIEKQIHFWPQLHHWLAATNESLATLQKSLSRYDNHALQGVHTTLNEAVTTFSQRATDLTEQKSKILIIGRIGTGKTALINAILARPLLPEKALTTTALNTLIEHGRDDRVRLIKQDDALPVEISLNDFKHHYQLLSVAGNPTPFVGYHHALLQCESHFLHDGIQLIDTPSLGNTSFLDDVSQYFLGSAQCVVYLLDATQPFNQFDSIFINQMLEKISLAKVFFVVNKLDLLAREDTIIEVRDFIHQLLAGYYRHSPIEGIHARRIYMISARKDRLPSQQQLSFQDMLDTLLASANIYGSEWRQVALFDLQHQMKRVIDAVEEAEATFYTPTTKKGLTFQKLQTVRQTLQQQEAHLTSWINSDDDTDDEAYTPQRVVQTTDIVPTIKVSHSPTTPFVRQAAVAGDTHTGTNQIFLSYRRSDSSGHTGRIYDTLLMTFARQQIFVDVATINPGDRFQVVIETALRQCQVLLAIIGPTWATVTDATGNLRLHKDDDWVRYEIMTALVLGIKVIPVLIHNASPLSKADLPTVLQPLAELHAASIRDEFFQDDLSRLVTQLDKTINT